MTALSLGGPEKGLFRPIAWTPGAPVPRCPVAANDRQRTLEKRERRNGYITTQFVGSSEPQLNLSCHPSEYWSGHNVSELVSTFLGDC
jgi:hypothetical protein